jgi:DNA repair exonuclease SbcCD nuclease subunit
MRPFRFLHAADLHLDTPFDGLARVAPAVAATLRDASLDAFDALVELALAREVAFLLLAGDVYDGAERGVRAQLRLLAGLERLSAAGIATLVAHGNHDPLEGWSAIRSWPAHVTVFEAGEPQAVAIERDGERLATVHGVSYAQRDPGENLALRLRRGSAPGLQIGVLHCDVGGDGAYSACTIEDLERTGLDYLALGHVHTHRVLRAGDPWVVYPGTLQGRGLRAAELGAKGAVLVEVGEHGVERASLEPLDRVRFEQVEVDAGRVDELSALRGLLADEAARRSLDAPGRLLVLRGVLTGRSPLHPELARPHALAALREAVESAYAEPGPEPFWESLQDRTRRELDGEQAALRDDFAGELARLAQGLARDDDALLRALAEAEAPYAAALGADEGQPTTRERRSLLRAATETALDALDEVAA